jgi:putative restriction endonuclease
MGASAAHDGDVLARFTAVRQHVRGGLVALNKPVTLLWALERVARGKPRLTRFAEAEAELQPRLDAWGTPGTAAGYAFWRLQNDGLWEVISTGDLPARSGDKEPRITALRAHASGGFTEPVFAQLAASPDLCGEVAEVLEQQLSPRPSRVRAQRLEPVWETVTRISRETCFSREVLAAYDSECLVCRWRCTAGGRAVALDGAHVRPHAKSGPDAVDNGVALCSIHHRLFDKGLFSWNADRELILSSQWQDDLRGDMPSLHEYAGKALSDPLPGWPRVADRHLTWHRQHVFRP